MPKLLTIITDPNPILRRISEKIHLKEISSKKFQGLCSDMAKTMKEKDGVGLSAPQIGRNIRLIVVNTKEGPVHMINPKIKRKSWKKEWGEEGCLSVPNVFAEVKRNYKITYAYLDKKGQTKKSRATGLMARIIQHEIDHLDGILFIDKARDIKSP